MKLYVLEACLMGIQVPIDYENQISIQLHASPYTCVGVSAEHKQFDFILN